MTVLIAVTFFAAILYIVAAFVRHCTASICQRHKVMIKPQVEAAIAKVQAITEEAEKEIIAIAVDAEKYAAMTVKELRQLCNIAGVQWRDAYGKNKHLKKDEMIAALV